MLRTFLLYLIALCNIHGDSRLEMSPETRYTIVINGQTIKYNEPLPSALLEDLSEVCEDFAIEDPEYNITITISTK